MSRLSLRRVSCLGGGAFPVRRVHLVVGAGVGGRRDYAAPSRSARDGTGPQAACPARQSCRGGGACPAVQRREAPPPRPQS